MQFEIIIQFISHAFIVFEKKFSHLNNLRLLPQNFLVPPLPSLATDFANSYRAWPNLTIILQCDLPGDCSSAPATCSILKPGPTISAVPELAPSVLDVSMVCACYNVCLQIYGSK